jgi:hypothetical protein
MALLKYIKGLDRRFSWSFIGVIIALFFGFFTIYKQFIEDRYPKLRYDILTSTSVLNVKEELSKLNVYYDGIDIRKQKQTMQIITLKVINDSSKDILKTFYDNNAPLGILISEGKIIKAEMIKASNNYLHQQLILTQPDDKILNFSSVIIEANEFFIIKLLILHPENVLPEISATGKVAGIRKITIREQYKERERQSFWTTTFSGNFLVQIIRFIAYIIIAVLLLFLMAMPRRFFTDKKDERKRKKIVQEFKSLTDLQLDENVEFIFEAYKGGNEIYLLSIYALIRSQNILDAACLRYDEIKNQKETHPNQIPIDRFEKNYVKEIWVCARRIHELLNTGHLKRVKNGLQADPLMKDTIEDFVRFLNNKGLISPKDFFILSLGEEQLAYNTKVFTTIKKQAQF